MEFKSLKTLIQSHLTIPEKIPAVYHRWYALYFTAYPAAVVIHFGFIFLFYFINQTNLALFNVGSVLLFLTVMIMTRHGHLFLGVALANLEVVTHATYATYELGWESGFHYLIFAPVTAIFLAPNTKTWFKSFLVITNMAFYLLAFFISHRDTYEFGHIHMMGVMNIMTLFGLLILIGITYSYGAFKIEKLLQKEHLKNRRLLHNILPREIAGRLHDPSSQTIADNYKEASILFIDIVGFTRMFKDQAPSKLVILLNDIFSKIDDLVAHYNLEKIKTIGDSYMVAAGVPIQCKNHAKVMAKFSLELLEMLEKYKKEQKLDLEFRIGLNSGPVVAGVIGKRKFIFDLWGDSVNIASRMESHGEPGKIHVGPDTFELLKDDYEFARRGAIEIKGKGTLETYFLLGEKCQEVNHEEEEIISSFLSAAS